MYSGILNQRYLFIGLVVVSFVTQFAFLSYPREVVFDEVHFGKFITAYCCTGERFFDIHPPHGKLLIAAAAKLGGYTGGPAFEGIGEQYADGVPVWALRFMPALAGSLVPVIVFVLLRQFGTSDAIALFGGLVFVFDNAFTVQSRIIALDGMLLAGVFGSLSLFLAGVRCYSHYPDIGDKGLKEVSDPFFSFSLWVWFIASGAVAGFAAGVKFTGLAALALIGIVIVVQVVRNVASRTFTSLHFTHQGEGEAAASAPFASGGGVNAIRWIGIGLLVFCSAAVVYLAGWKVHYAILDQPGSGDVWQTPTGSFLADTAEMHEKMLNANYGLSSTHPYSSMWWSWPLMTRPIFYWQSSPYPSGALGDAPDPTPGQQSRGLLYFIGNPIVWWGGSILFVIALLYTLREFVGMSSAGRHKSQISNFQFPISSGRWFLLAGYFISYVPLVRIPRPLFMYHYMMPLVFSVLFGLVWLDSRYRKQLKYMSHLPMWYFLTLGVLITGFILFVPLTYGFPADFWQARLFWFDTWR